MSPLFIGQHSIELPSTPSTNLAAQKLLKDRPPEGTLVWTREQTAGRGQAGNSWIAQPGLNLTFSIILYPEFLSAREVFYLSKMTSIAIRGILAKYLSGNEILIKWPNDLLADKEKIAGILIENQFEGALLKSTVIGIGVNVNQVIFPSGLNTPASSMKLSSGMEFETKEVLESLLSALESQYLNLRAGKLALLDRQYFAGLYGYQDRVKVEIEGKEKECYLVGVDKSGRLALKDGEQLRYFDLKELRFVL